MLALPAIDLGGMNIAHIFVIIIGDGLALFHAGCTSSAGE